MIFLVGTAARDGEQLAEGFPAAREQDVVRRSQKLPNLRLAADARLKDSRLLASEAHAAMAKRLASRCKDPVWFTTL